MRMDEVYQMTIPEGNVHQIKSGDTVIWQRQKRYRYIKLLMTALANASKTIVQISELEFVDASGNKFAWPSGTIATSTIATSDSGETPETPDMLIDGSTATKYCSTQFVTGAYVLLDLGDGNGVDVIRYNKWRWYTANDTATYPERNLKDFSLLGSNDGTTFDVLDAVTNYSAPASNYALAYEGGIE